MRVSELIRSEAHPSNDRTYCLEETPICCVAATSDLSRRSSAKTEALLEKDINNVPRCPRHLSPRYARPIGIRCTDNRFESV